MRIEELDTPAITVDLDILENNVQSLSRYARDHGLRLRPHTKTHKIPAIAKMQVESGCSGITVAKAGEAEVMAHAGIDDILIHYPVFGAAKLDRLAALAGSCKITLAIDSLAAAQAISEAATRAGVTIHLLVEFDVGMRRCGVASAADVETLAAAIQKLPNVRFAGISMYPGHIWDLPAQQGPALRALSEKVAEVLARLRQAGIECETVSGGSTPTAYTSHLVEGLTEMRPGTYVFNDRNTLGAAACELAQCALRVLVTVVSNAVPDRAVVDGGSKTFASDRWISGDKTGFGYVIDHPDIVFEGMSEEHGHLDIGHSADKPRLGEKLAIVPNHVCACVNMHDRIYYHRKGIVEGSWEVAARGMVR